MRLVRADKNVGTKHEPLGKIDFPVEVPEYETLDEFVNACGGEAKALEFSNGQVATNAKNVARAIARNFTVAEGTEADQYPGLVEKLIKQATEAAAGYSPSSTRGTGQNTINRNKAAKLDRIKELSEAGELTQEAIAELLADVA